MDYSQFGAADEDFDGKFKFFISLRHQFIAVVL